jgi:hypothetical protein
MSFKNCATKHCRISLKFGMSGRIRTYDHLKFSLRRTTMPSLRTSTHPPEFSPRGNGKSPSVDGL